MGNTFLNRILDVSGNTSLAADLYVNGSSLFKDNVSVMGNTFLNRKLDVSGNTSLAADLYVNGSSLFKDNVSVIGNTFLNRKLDVSGNTSLAADLYVNGSSLFKDNVSVMGNTFLNRILDVSGNTSLAADLYVNGSSLFKDNVSVMGNTFLNRILDVSGNTSLAADLYVNGSSLFKDNVSVMGNTFLNRILDVSGNTSLAADLYVNGSSLFKDNVSVMGNTFLNRILDVYGNTSLASDLYVNGSSLFKDNVSVMGNTFLNRILDVSGNTSLAADLYVNGSSLFKDNVSIMGNTFLNRTLDVSGNTSLASYLYVNGSSRFQDNVSIMGNTFLNQTLDVLGNTSIASKLFVNGDSYFNKINASLDTTLIGTLNVSGQTQLKNTTITGIISMNDNVSMLKDTSVDGLLNVSGNTSFCNLSVRTTTTLNGIVSINNKANISTLTVYGDTALNNTSIMGPILDIQAPRVIMTGNISMIGGTTLNVEGTIRVTNLNYINLIRDATSANLYLGNSAINQIDIKDFVDPSGNVSKNITGFANFYTNVGFLNKNGDKTLKIGENGLPMKLETYLTNESDQKLNGLLDINCSSSVTGRLDYTGPIILRGDQIDLKSGILNVSSATNFGNNIAVYKELRVKSGGSFVIESSNVSIIELQRQVQVTNELNISNNGTGPALRVSQLNPAFAEIMLLESSGLDVYSVGDYGNTQIRGKIRLGYDVLSSITTNVSNVIGDLQGTNPFRSYQLDVSGGCYVKDDIDVNRNFSVNGTTYLNGLLTLKNDVTSYSDRRIKKNIHKLESCLDKITNIHGYTYQRTDMEDDRQFIGMIAQEIEGPFPELVTDSGDIKTVNYPAFTSVLLECIQELKEKINLLENKILK
jgi:hypothetical protein